MSIKKYNRSAYENVLLVKLSAKTNINMHRKIQVAKGFLRNTGIDFLQEAIGPFGQGRSIQSKKDSKGQESIQSSTTSVPGYQMGK